MNILNRFKNSHKKDIKKYNNIANKVMELDDKYSKLSLEDLKDKSEKIRNKIAKGKTTIEDEIVELLAIAREGAYKTLKMKPFFVQIKGALAMHYGNIAEMKTGEGKTLTAVLSAYLNAIAGMTVHIVTVNEYLTQRDAREMSPFFTGLGLTVGFNVNGLSESIKREQYAKDILYTTNNELAFDYLRDNMVTDIKDKVMRSLDYVIVDEADSVLIDEARTPLIISGDEENKSKLFRSISNFVEKLSASDYEIDYENKNVFLNENGIDKVEKEFKIENLYDVSNVYLLQHIGQSLRAHFIMKKDIDYMVSNGEVKIIDQFTGRVMEGRVFSEGLHQSIEAKENLEIRAETRTNATITFQNYFNLYKKLSGMTGTAKTEEEELMDIYNLKVIEIETNKPLIREDKNDFIFANKKDKWNYIIKEIKNRKKKMQPILVGTTSVEDSEILSKLLKKEKIDHNLLNAKNNEREAEIIKKAGEKNSLTIATNMAGRGTDIKLGDGVADLGGLYVIGTERNESRRIDNQLRGRAGRQGDPGESRFFISMEDELIKRFGGDRAKNLLEKISQDGEPIENKIFTRTFENAQKRIEGQNFDIRKDTVKYDNVLKEQRKVIYNLRDKMLSASEDVSPIIKDQLNEVIENIFENNSSEDIYNILKSDFLSVKKDQIEKGKEFNKDWFIKKYEEKHSVFGNEFNLFQKELYLKIVDELWMDHLNNINLLREGIFLRAYSQIDPLVAYEEEAYELFKNLINEINYKTTSNILRTEIKRTTKRIK